MLIPLVTGNLDLKSLRATLAHMGYNTTIVICNDTLHEIGKDETFGKKLSEAVGKHWTSKTPVLFAHSARVIAQHHADTTSLSLVGGNTGHCMGFVHGYRDLNGLETKIAALKDIAKTFGYRLVKMDENQKSRNDLQPYSGSGCIL